MVCEAPPGSNTKEKLDVIELLLVGGLLAGLGGVLLAWSHPPFRSECKTC